MLAHPRPYLLQVWMLGHANVGKSALVNTIKRLVSPGDSGPDVTTSSLPGTTVSGLSLRIPLKSLHMATASPAPAIKEIVLMDTPGLQDRDSVTSFLPSRDAAAAVLAGRPVRPRGVAKLLPGQSVLLGDGYTHISLTH